MEPQQQGRWEESPENGFASTSPPRMEMPELSFGTYDEASMQHSHDFVTALQELKNLRPQLYSAAEHCESSYLYNNQKQMVLEILKDYSVKALVNAVDHLGTVAFKLNDLLSQQMSEVSAAEIRAGSLTQRLRSCQEHSDREGLKQQSLAKSTQANHKHYILPDIAEISTRPTDQEHVMLRESFDPEQIQSPLQTTDGLGGSSRNLAWHFAVDKSSPAKNRNGNSHNQSLSSKPTTSPNPGDLDGSSSGEGELSNTFGAPVGVSDRSKASRSKSAERSRSVEKMRYSENHKSSKIPGRSQSTERRRPSSKVSTSNALGSLERSSSQITFSESREVRAPSRSKSLLRSLLSRGRNEFTRDMGGKSL